MLQAESGYSVDIRQECWVLHLKLAAFPREQASSPRSPEQVNAIAQLDQYDGDAFSRTRPALRYLCPSQFSR